MRSLKLVIYIAIKSKLRRNAFSLKYFISDLRICEKRKSSQQKSIGSISVQYLSFGHRSGQTVQTQIRLLLEEQSDQGLHCLLLYLHHFDKIPLAWPLCLNFR